jgi:hypothetical protein
MLFHKRQNYLRAVVRYDLETTTEARNINNASNNNIINCLKRKKITY